MEKKRYLISDAAKLVNVETHVLRYWEDELGITVRRNEMGHRYYTTEDIQIFEKIKEYKKSGYQLKEIRELLPEEFLQKTDQEGKKKHSIIIPMENSYMIKQQKMEKIQELFTEIFRNVIVEQRQEMKKEISEEVSNRVIKQMDYLMRIQEEEQEKHFKELDEKLRNYQNQKKEKKKTSIFKNKKHRGKKKENKVEGWVPNQENVAKAIKE